jgi:hypothetical protein
LKTLLKARRLDHSPALSADCGLSRSPHNTATDIADSLEHWYTSGAADGFNIPPTLPDGMVDFAALVIPELQRRRLFRTAYEGRTLRENLDLARPENQFASRHQRAAE